MDLLKILDTKPIPAIVDPRTLGVSGDTSGDYWLPTPMSLYQKELTDQIVSLHYSDILRYFETRDYRADVVLESLRTLCRNSEYVATHPCLLIDHNMPKSLVFRETPTQLAESSGKFQVLRSLINLVQEYETNTAIVCRPGRTMDLLEALLLGNKVDIKRYDGSSVKNKPKVRNYPCKCHLFPSSGWNTAKYPLTGKLYFDMIVCLDISVDAESPEFQSLVKFSRSRQGKYSRAPIVRLITINSVDHCDLYFGRLYSKESQDYLENVTAAVVVLRDRAGTLPPDLRPIYSQGLSYLVEWLEDPSLPWPLPDVYPIKRYNSMDVERSLLTEVHFNQIDDHLKTVFETTRKRGRPPSSSYQNKIPEPESFYDTKRVKNEYVGNPLKQGMSQLTGITTANENGGSDYHLSSGILTHKLIHAIGDLYTKFELTEQELKSYEEVSPIAESHMNFFEEEKNKLKQQLNVVLQKIDENEISSKALVSENETTIKAISTLDESLRDQLESEMLSTGPRSAFKSLIKELYDLKEAIESEERKEESRKSERLYMSEEIERAEKSIKDSEDSIAKLHEERKNLEGKLETLSKSSTLEINTTVDQISELKLQLDSKTEKYNDLQKELEELMGKLDQLPTSRVRGTNTNGSLTNRRGK